MTETSDNPALITAMRILAASSKSEQEMYRRLQMRGYAVDKISQAILKLKKAGLINDHQYAQDLVIRFSELKPSGNKKIRFELKRRGIEKSLIDELMQSMNEDIELERAREIATLRWNKLHQLDHKRRIKRLYDFLMRRGFSYHIAKQVVSELTQDDT